MDKYNVITPTPDLTELENDMVQWSNLPYKFRLRSDEECIRKYNLTNIQLFNRIKAMILNNTFPEDEKLIGKSISESFEITFDNNEETNDKRKIASKLEESPNIVIISPLDDNENYTMDDLNAKYTKYLLLTQKNRKFSNSYSINLWGYDVPNMYSIIRQKIMDNEADTTNDLNIISKSDSTIYPILKSVTEASLYNDKLSILKSKLDSVDESIHPYHKAQYESLFGSISEEIDYLSILPKVVPFFTIDEMEEFGLSNNEAANINPKYYYNTLSKLMIQYENNRTDELESKIISLGWNPSVPLTESNLQFARERQAKWLNKKGINIIDISNIPITENIVLESSSQMNKLYKERGLYPIYISLCYCGGIFSKGIRFIKHSKYTHAGLSLDSDLKAISTFQFSQDWKGFANDSLDKYVTENKDSLLMVLALFVDNNTKIKIDSVIRDFISKQEKTKYGFGNLYNIMVNKSAENDPENLYLVCSQFVDTVLKLADIDITNKSSNLVIPEDFARVNNPKVFKLYEGLARKYNEKEVEDKIYSLFQTMNPNSIKYSQIMESSNDIISIAFMESSDNEEANSILKEMRDLLTPTSIITEKKIPIEFNDKGDLIIKTYKSLEDQYQEAHKLLLQYGDKNIEGIKHELARLFAINTIIEKKIKKMKKDDDKYKKFIDLRARVLNDFKKYFKIVAEAEPDFDFCEYFKTTEYYNGNIIVDNSILKITGKLIKIFLKSLGL